MCIRLEYFLIYNCMQKIIINTGKKKDFSLNIENSYDSIKHSAAQNT